MLTIRPVTRTTGGNENERYLRVTETTYQIGATAVTVYGADAHNRGPESLHPDAAVTLHIHGDIDENDGFVAVHMHSEYWSRPTFGTDLCTVPDRTQGLIIKKKDGDYAVLLPIVSENYKCDLRGDTDGLCAVLFSWYDKLQDCKAPAFAYAEGADPYILLYACAEAGLTALGRGGVPRVKRRYPEIFEYLGWCSWDAMQIRVSEAGLLEKCREFKEKNIPVRWAILDDMWAEVRTFWDAPYDTFGDMVGLMHSSPLYSFEADPIRFPHGLKSCIEKMNEMGMTVGMWHPATGYWRGIDPESPLFTEIKNLLIQRPDGRWIPSPEPGKMFLFYQKFHAFLRSCGAEFVKIDFQSCMRQHYRGIEPIGQTARKLQSAIEASVGMYFDNSLINCMGMASENMWNRMSSNISRCSDDFTPENRAWFAKHIMQCSYNSLIQGQFNTCDWDMWWTDDGQATKNSVLRAVSGGPIYVSDKLGRSNQHILEPLVLDDGRILRCDRPATPVRSNLTADPEHTDAAIMVQNTCCEGAAGVLAAFNIHANDAPAEVAFTPADICGMCASQTYAMYEYFTGEFRLLDHTDVYRYTLDNQDEFRLWILVPYVDNKAVFGIVDKMIAPKTVIRMTSNPLETEVACHGRFAYVQDGVLHITEM